MKLESVFLQTSTHCNARCIICPYKDTYAKSPESHGKMCLKLYKKILDDLGKKYDGEIGFYFQYEPLTDNRLPTFIELAKGACPKARTSISTNCSMLDDRWAKALIDTKSLDYVYFNILGGTKETFEEMMPPLKWERVIAHLNSFAEKFDGKMFINFMKTNKNKDEIELLRKAVNKKVEIITEYWASNRGGSVDIDKPSDAKTRYSREGDTCIPLRKRIYIYFDGIVPLCCQCWERDLIIGDVSKENLYDIFNSEKKHTGYDICKNCR